MTPFKDLGASCHVLIHNLQDNLHGNANVTVCNAARVAPHQAQHPAPAVCEHGTLLWLWRLLSGLGGFSLHLLNQGQDKGKGSQANGSHADGKRLLRKARGCVRQLLPEDDLQYL